MTKEMKNSFLLVLIFSAFFSNSSLAAVGDADQKIKELEAKETKTINLPDIDKGNLKVGFKYYILEDHDIGLSKAVIYIKGGEIYDPSGKNGLSSIVSYLVRSGGTLLLKPDQVDRVIDKMAASISLSAQKEVIAASVVSKSDSFDKSISLLLDMFFRPSFDERRFELIKKQLKGAVKRRSDSLDELAGTGFAELLYGRESKWGSYSTVESIDQISLDDVREYHKRFFNPKNMIVGVAGDVDKGTFLKLLRSYKFYPTDDTQEIAVPEGEPAAKEGIYIVDKDATQVVIEAGHKGSTRFNPDKYALIIMNYMLGGGGFKTRLPALVRVERGLAYAVSSSYTFGPPEAAGWFDIYIKTKTPSAYEAYSLAVEQMTNFVNGDDIKDEELLRAKRSILQAMIFQYSSAINVISNVVRFSYFGYPDDYVKKYSTGIEAVAMEDVKRVAKKYLRPDNMQVVLVGKDDELKKQFNNNSKIYDLTIDE